MDIAAFPADEAERMAALRGYAVLDTPPEQEFDELTQFASALCDTPIALVSLVDTERQWFKSRVGLDVPETSRNLAFCSHAILQRGIFEVEDASRDKRFADNPLVASDPNIRFYAGAPLLHPSGYQLGTLCVIDRVPRKLTPIQRQGLEVLSRQVISQLELRRQVRQLARLSLEIAESRDQALAGTRAKDIFLASMSHELRTPLNAILGLSQFLLERDELPADATADLHTIDRSGRHLLAVIEDILGYAQLELERPQLRARAFDLGELLGEVEAGVRPQLRGR
ncbi:MAG TPA: histidine kinase dimerization/phospho-acceptor domain-containing protein, partial [Nannocystis sp.]